MKWNWFSPLPPARSGIADYTASLLPYLAGKAEVTLWTDQSHWDPALEKHARVRRFREELVMELNAADVNIYHMGNNPEFHGKIWDIARRHSGVMVLHDTCLQHFFAGLYVYAWGDPGRYLNAMRRYHGAEGYKAGADLAADLISIGPVSERYPLTAHAVENALGVVVHTPEAMKSCSSQYRKPAACIPLPHASGSAPGERMSDGHESRADRKFRLVMIGFIGANRRLHSILEALATFPLLGRIQLDVYGDVTEHENVARQILTLGLESVVTLHGFLPDKALDEELAACDLAFNLRYPTMGESSLSQLRYWTHALPTLVTPVGWYATLPEEAVGFVPWENETQSIHEHLHALIAEPERYRRMGQVARDHLIRHHSPEAYVESLAEFVVKMPVMTTQLMARQMAERAGRVMASWGLEKAEPAFLQTSTATILRLVGRE